MKKSTTRLYSWATNKASSEKASLWLGLLFCLEFFLFIPLDAVLIFFCLQRRHQIFSLVLIATLASALSGILGYGLGHFVWHLIHAWIVPYLISTASFESISQHLIAYENGAVFFAALVPFPLKAFSLVAGAFHLGFITFITYLILGRLLRFSLIGFCMALWGEKIKNFVDRHFHRLFMLLGAKIGIAFFLFWLFAR